MQHFGLVVLGKIVGLDNLILLQEGGQSILHVGRFPRGCSLLGEAPGVFSICKHYTKFKLLDRRVSVSILGKWL
ncbi:hypothetical protein AAG906_030979 [Vitis piasezkii]